jgi:hypothetical protein
MLPDDAPSWMGCECSLYELSCARELGGKRKPAVRSLELGPAAKARAMVGSDGTGSQTDDRGDGQNDARQLLTRDGG